MTNRGIEFKESICYLYALELACAHHLYLNLEGCG